MASITPTATDFKFEPRKEDTINLKTFEIMKAYFKKATDNLKSDPKTKLSHLYYDHIRVIAGMCSTLKNKKYNPRAVQRLMRLIYTVIVLQSLRNTGYVTVILETSEKAEDIENPQIAKLRSALRNEKAKNAQLKKKFTDQENELTTLKKRITYQGSALIKLRKNLKENEGLQLEHERLKTFINAYFVNLMNLRNPAQLETGGHTTIAHDERNTQLVTQRHIDEPIRDAMYVHTIMQQFLGPPQIHPTQGEASDIQRNSIPLSEHSSSNAVESPTAREKVGDEEQRVSKTLSIIIEE